MTDQIQTKELPKQPAEQPQEETIKLTFSFPDVITVGHYQTYQAARLKFINDSREAVSTDVAAYMGARALIQAGVVHIKSSDPTAQIFVAELMALIQKDDQTNTPINIMRLVGGLVASKVESESLAPFLSGRRFFIDATPKGSTPLLS